MAEWADLYELTEDERIDMIGHTVSYHYKVVSFMVDDDAKADRYIAKLHANYPIVVLGRGKGPVEGVVWVKVGPILN